MNVTAKSNYNERLNTVIIFYYLWSVNSMLGSAENFEEGSIFAHKNWTINLSGQKKAQGKPQK